jgi:hypothetical protein
MSDKAKKIGTELTQRQTGFTERLKRLLEIDLDMLSKYGPFWHKHSMNTMRVEAASRFIYYHELYQKIINVPGVICEFGVQYGATLSTLTNLRSIYEPFNYSRRIYGFDTFKGLLQTSVVDGKLATDGDYAVTNGFESTLEEILYLLEADSPMSHIKKFELIKGDATQTVDHWLKDNPHVVISMCIFDMDIYAPTKNVLEKIISRLTKGSILVFDEINHDLFPGETIAVDEVLKLNKIRLQRTPLQTHSAWAVWE